MNSFYNIYNKQLWLLFFSNSTYVVLVVVVVVIVGKYDDVLVNFYK